MQRTAPEYWPKPILGLGQSGGWSNSKTEGVFSRTDHYGTARSRGIAWEGDEIIICKRRT